MARRKKRRYADGGGVEAEEIVVQGRRPTANAEFSSFDLSRIGGDIGGGMRGGMGDGMGGADPSARLAGGAAPTTKDSIRFGKTYSPVGKVYGPRITREGFNVSGGYNPLSKVAGGRYEEEGFSAGLGYDPRRNYVGGDVSFSFKKGGKVTAKAGKAKAKSGTVKTSSASKRADGIATKGKTRGKMC
jgi:hypothetical protein